MSFNHCVYLAYMFIYLFNTAAKQRTVQPHPMRSFKRTDDPISWLFDRLVRRRNKITTNKKKKLHKNEI